MRHSTRHSTDLAGTVFLLFVLCAGALGAGLGGGVAVAEATGAPVTSLSGWLHIVYGDAPPGGGQTQMYLLIDAAGHATELVVPDSVVTAAGGRSALNHRRVTVRGEATLTASASGWGDAPSVVTVHAIQPEEATSPMSGEQAVSGPQKWVSVLCRFADATNITPQTKTWIEGLMLGSDVAPGLDHYWREVSFNNVNLTGSAVFGWYNLPQPRSYYVYGTPLKLDFQRAATDCTGVADADVSFPSYVGINLMFNEDLDCCAWGGSWTLTLDGQTRTYRVTWLPPWGYENQGVIAHEMGHGFGLPHSSGPYSQTYDSRWDVMSDLWGNCPPYDPAYGCVGTHTISYHKDILGWIPSSQKYVAAAGTSQTITLEPLDQLTSTASMMAQIAIPGSSTQFYTVETRRLAGYDTPLPGHAVIIHKVDTTRSDRDAQVVDPDANGNPDDAGAMWLSGETFVDSTYGISVAVTGTTTNGFLVTVSNGATGPTSYTLTVTVSGTGSVTSAPSGIACPGACAASFASGASVTLTPSGGTLTGWGGACAGAGTGPCTVTMTADRSASATFAVAVPDITVSPLTLAFGAAAVGSKTVQAVTVRNDGAGSLVLGTVSVGGSEFAKAKNQDLCSSHTLTAGQSCTVGVAFSPTSTGAKSGTLTIPSNDPDENPVVVALSGTGGSAAVPDITVTPLTVSFGSVPVGSTSTQAVTVRNDGTANLVLGALTLSASTGEIAKVSGGDLCSGQTLAAGQACTVGVALAPTSTGGKSGTLTIPSNDPDENPVVVALSGTGSSVAVPDITVSPLTLAFGAAAVGSKTVQAVTVRNDGAGSLVLGTVSVGGSEFAKAKNQDLCSSHTLTAGQSCTVGVAFSPTSTGAKSGTLTIPSNDPDENPVVVALSGTGGSVGVPDITVTPLTVSFGSVPIGSKSTQAVAVRNDGTANLLLGGITLSANTSEITKLSDLCSGQTLVPGQSCAVALRLKAVSAGAKTATLAIPSNDPDENPVSVSVTGTVP